MSASSQSMKPATAAKKLGVLLQATPADFQAGMVTRQELNQLQADPPTWLIDLRTHGPHPKQEVARKLGISISGLARGGISDALTTAQIKAMLEDQPEWLRIERTTQAEVRSENARINKRDAERRAREASHESKH